MTQESKLLPILQNAMLQYKRTRIENMAKELLKKGAETEDLDEQDRLLEDYFQLVHLLKKVYEKMGLD